MSTQSCQYKMEVSLYRDVISTSITFTYIHRYSIFCFFYKKYKEKYKSAYRKKQQQFYIYTNIYTSSLSLSQKQQQTH
jgi:hypothetical protein